jgi:hypothetical protein
MCIDRLNTRNRAGSKKVSYLLPVVRRPKSKPQNYLILIFRCSAAPQPANIAWRSPEGRVKCAVESADALEARSECDLGNWQWRVINHALGKVQPPCLRHGDWRRANMLQEKPVQMPRPDTEPLC